MREVIDALMALQVVDDEVREFQLQRDELASNLDRLKTILNQMAGELDEKREKLSEATKFFDQQQETLRLDGERMAKAKQKLASVTRTKEYAAMQRELDNLRRKYSEDEQELKRLSEAIEEYKSSISGQESKLQDLENEVSREEDVSSDRLNELDQSIGAIADRKKSIEVKVGDEILRRYRRVLKRREGKAVVASTGGRCTGCQMMLPPQVYILVQRLETLETCPGCQRYLYHETEAETDA